MDKKLLYLHNGDTRETTAWLDDRINEAGFSVDMYWAYNSEFPERLDGYAGVVLSGSGHGAYEDIPFIHQEHEVIRDIAARRIPTLGICFGSQILASALCGRDQVFRRSFCEVGYKWLDVHRARYPDDALTAGLDERMYMFVWHNDEVRAEHPDMAVLASTDLCPNQVWRYRDLPMWGIQGHAEITRDGAADWFGGRRPRLEDDGADVDDLIANADDALQAKTMFSNFLAFCGEDNRALTEPT
ncbi:MAG: type 1 glutamine amidotransferase [Rhodospirillales bacterium]|jgi:GMP synthase (glutamine-hydrolysing)|nr:type 1 glutamine amidotransferase [Rhodospirillales bacterium]